MPTIKIITRIDAPKTVCFDLSRSIDLHQSTMESTNEKAVGGRTSGLIVLGETVTWEAKHFGIKQRLTSKITGFDRPHWFRDEMVQGAFRRFTHDHFFEDDTEGTLMRDVFDFESPFGWLGRVFNRIVLTNYMKNLLTQRNQVIKTVAENSAANYLLHT